MQDITELAGSSPDVVFDRDVLARRLRLADFDAAHPALRLARLADAVLAVVLRRAARAAVRRRAQARRGASAARRRGRNFGLAVARPAAGRRRTLIGMPHARATSLSRWPGTTVAVFFCPFGPIHVIVFCAACLDSPAFSFLEYAASLANAFLKMFIVGVVARATVRGGAAAGTMRPCAGRTSARASAVHMLRRSRKSESRGDVRRDREGEAGGDRHAHEDMAWTCGWR